MIDWTFGWLKQEPQPRLTAALTLLLLLVFISSALRVASITLAIKNDSRIAAGKFLETLPAGKTLEYSLYTPNFHYTQLKVEQYPLYFLKFEKEELPEDSRFVYNDGENGVELRKPDYLVLSDWIYTRFDDEFTCQRYPEECSFQKRLQTGQTNYKLIQTFHYQLPGWLPQIQPVFINPTIKIYQRTSNGS